MTIKCYEPKGGAPKNLAANVEILLDGELAGLKLAGISVWKSDAGYSATMPSRAYTGKDGEQKHYDYLRGIGQDSAAIKLLKGKIVDAFREQMGIHDDEPSPF